MWIKQVLEQSILLMCHHPFIARAEFRILAKWETWIRFPNNSVINLTFSLLTFSPTLTLSSETPSEWRLMKRIHYGLVIICSFSLIHTHFDCPGLFNSSYQPQHLSCCYAMMYVVSQRLTLDRIYQSMEIAEKHWRMDYHTTSCFPSTCG